MRNRRQWLVGTAGLGLIGGCSGFGLTQPSPGAEIFQIEDLRPQAAPSSPPVTPVALTLLIGGAPTTLLNDTDRMVYTRDGHGYAYYQFASWSDKPSQRLASLTEARLSARGRFRAVAAVTSGMRADRLLTLRLDEFVHDDSRSPGEVRLAITAVLLDGPSRQLIGQQTFRARAPVAQRNAPSAARAASAAMTDLLDALCVWTESQAGIA